MMVISFSWTFRWPPRAPSVDVWDPGMPSIPPGSLSATYRWPTRLTDRGQSACLFLHQQRGLSVHHGFWAQSLAYSFSTSSLLIDHRYQRNQRPNEYGGLAPQGDSGCRARGGMGRPNRGGGREGVGHTRGGREVGRIPGRSSDESCVQQ